MGTWGSGSFDNDDASDFAIDFESDGLAALTDALDIAEVEELEAAPAQRAIAAAEILALRAVEPRHRDRSIRIADPCPMRLDLLQASAEAGEWFERRPEELVAAVRRYHEETPPTALLPIDEARAFEAWLLAGA